MSDIRPTSNKAIDSLCCILRKRGVQVDKKAIKKSIKSAEDPRIQYSLIKNGNIIL